MISAEKHNQLARGFVLTVASETSDYAETLVVIESVILATMLVLQERDGFSPSESTEMVEAVVQAAIERFVDMSARE